MGADVDVNVVLIAFSISDQTKMKLPPAALQQVLHGVCRSKLNPLYPLTFSRHTHFDLPLLRCQILKGNKEHKEHVFT